MKKRIFSAFAVLIISVLFGCSPKLVRPVVPNNSTDFFLDYQAKVDFGDETTLNVTVQLPPEAPVCDSFCFPIQVPGAYEIIKYGKYIDKLTAYDENEKPIPYGKVDSAFYIFDTSTPVRKIVYTVHQSSKFKADSIASFEGTRIKSGFCMLNPYAAFGFFPKFKNMPVRIKLNLPENWDIGTSLTSDSAGYLYAKSYYDMQDNPIITGELSRAAFRKDNKQFFIYTYSDDPAISARRLKRVVKGAVSDADNFLNGLIPSNYTFLFSFVDDSLISVGAHEHVESSLYSFSVKNFMETKKDLKWVVRHELFHTLTPLYLSGDEIEDLDFINRCPVSNLWFYEGLAQWAAFKMQLISGSMSPEEYLKFLSGTYILSDMHDDSLDFITLSRRVLDGKHRLGDVYRRGFIFGNLLDMYIINITGGNMTLRDVLLKMKDMYPLGNPFPSDSLFSIISGMTHPYTGEFLKKNLFRNDTCDISGLFDKFGITYSAREKHPVAVSDFGIILRPSQDYQYLLILGTYKEAGGFGYKEGDTLLTIDGRVITPYNFGMNVRNFITGSPGIEYTAEVRGQDGLKRTIHAVTIPYFTRHKMKFTGEGLYDDVWLTR